MPSSNGEYLIAFLASVSVFDGTSWSAFDRGEARAAGIPIPDDRNATYVEGADGSTWLFSSSRPTAGMSSPPTRHLHRHDGTSWAELRPPIELSWSLMNPSGDEHLVVTAAGVGCVSVATGTSPASTPGPGRT
ncbi:MAG TPA: hypothetical protein VLD62_13555 [Acidimicrobiia bacterium]|nr:hypothetical protein [Acidimicrobiia bacterium]